MMPRIGCVGMTAIALLGAVGGWLIKPDAVLDPVVRQAGVFRTDSSQVLRVTLRRMKAQNRINVLTIRTDVTVRVEHSEFPLISGRQVLKVPAGAEYFVDLASLNERSLSYDPERKIVSLTVPALLMGDVSFASEKAIVENSGLLTFSDDQVQDLLRRNYARARMAATRFAQRAEFVTAAQNNARANLQQLLGTAFESAGHENVRVEITFLGPRPSS